MKDETVSATTEISFEEVRIADTIAFKTRHSVYTLLIIDPPTSRGMLIGGHIGSHPSEATLWSRLKVGRSARLLVEGADGRRRLLRTSIVLALLHIKA